MFGARAHTHQKLLQLLQYAFNVLSLIRNLQYSLVNCKFFFFPLYFYCFALYVLFFKILVFSLYFWNARNCFSQTTADKSHLEIWKIGSAVWSFEFRISFWIQFKFSPIKLFLVSCFLVFLKSSARAEKWMGSLNRIGYEVSETCCS